MILGFVECPQVLRVATSMVLVHGFAIGCGIVGGRWVDAPSRFRRGRILPFAVAQEVEAPDEAQKEAEITSLRVEFVIVHLPGSGALLFCAAIFYSRPAGERFGELWRGLDYGFQNSVRENCACCTVR